jgi:hypothetical protein
MLRVRWKDELFDMVSDANIEHYGLAWNVAAVPEPASGVLILLAAGMFMQRRRRT